MSGYFDGSASSTTLEDLNRVLISARVPPARTLEGLAMDSDAGLALTFLRNSQRAASAKGWWFNTDRRVTLSPDVNDEILVADGVSAVRSRPLPGEDCGPEVRLAVSEGQAGGKLWNRDEDSWEFVDDVLVDIVRNLNLNDLPQVFREFCVQMAISEFAPIMGYPVNPDNLDRARFELEREDAENMERFNLLNTSSDVVQTWYR